MPAAAPTSGIAATTTLCLGNLDEHLDHRYGAGIARPFPAPVQREALGTRPDPARVGLDRGAHGPARRIAPSIFSGRGGGARRCGQAPSHLPGTRQLPARSSGPWPGAFHAAAAAIGRAHRYARAQPCDRGRRAPALETHRLDASTAGARQLCCPTFRRRCGAPSDHLVTLPLVLRACLRSIHDSTLRCSAFLLRGRRIAGPQGRVESHVFGIPARCRTMASSVEISALQSTPNVDGDLCEQVIRDCNPCNAKEPRRGSPRHGIRLPCGYPVPTHGRAAIVEGASDWLAGRAHAASAVSASGPAKTRTRRSPRATRRGRTGPRNLKRTVACATTCLIVRAGDESLHPRWRGDGEPRNFRPAGVLAFGATRRNGTSDACDFYHSMPGPRWPAHHAICSQNAAFLSGYQARRVRMRRSGRDARTREPAVRSLRLVRTRLARPESSTGT